MLFIKAGLILWPWLFTRLKSEPWCRCSPELRLMNCIEEGKYKPKNKVHISNSEFKFILSILSAEKGQSLLVGRNAEKRIWILPYIKCCQLWQKKHWNTGWTGSSFTFSFAYNFFVTRDRPLHPLMKKCSYDGTFWFLMKNFFGFWQDSNPQIWGIWVNSITWNFH